MFCVFFYLLLLGVLAKDNQYKIVSLEEGDVKGEKYWNGNYYEFYGVPYAKVPKGKDRFKAPLPPEPWKDVFEAKDETIVCPQVYYTGENSEDVMIIGQEDCLVMNLFVPTIADEDHTLPVLVYIHSGAFSIGDGNMAKYQHLLKHDVIVISFNYRLGAIGFACLKNEDIPGNAGLKDQVAALKWINKKIRKFGGDPTKVTVAGFSVGAAMAELLSFSESTKGLIDKIILESGSALSPWAINREPVKTAVDYAVSLGYNDTKSLEDLTKWYLNQETDLLALKSLNFFLPNGTFGFAPCIENLYDGAESFLTESPMDILKNGKGSEVAIVTGFSNMEGLSRINNFESWSELMEKDFSNFLPTDLQFKDEKGKDAFVKQIKKYYFDDKKISENVLQGYVDYNSDFMIKYSMIKSLKCHAKNSKRSIFAYEFSYVGNLNSKHNYMDRINGASHRDQTSYILDFHTWTNKYEDLDTRDRMTVMWTDFVKYEDPTAYESLLIDFKWHKYSNEKPNYLRINKTMEMRTGLFEDTFRFWDQVYENNYRNPTAADV